MAFVPDLAGRPADLSAAPAGCLKRRLPASTALQGNASPLQREERRVHTSREDQRFGTVLQLYWGTAKFAGHNVMNGEGIHRSAFVGLS